MDQKTPRQIMAGFYAWDAGDLAHDPSKPWQVATATGKVVASYATEGEANAKVDELVEKQRGNFPP